MTINKFHQRNLQTNSSNIEDVQLNTNLENVICPICLDFPHNVVLLKCSSYEKGCRPFMCNTDHTHSNCLDRFKTAYGMSAIVMVLSTSDSTVTESIHPLALHGNCHAACPLCRGEVTGWIVVDEIRVQLNKKRRCCEQEHCAFIGNYLELQQHTTLEHPNASPSKIDPGRQLDWENIQQSSEIIDVLSTIHSEVPHGVVSGDYVIEYGGNETGDEFEDFPGDEGNWWTSCMLYNVFDNFRTSRNRRRSRVSETRSGQRYSSYDASNSDEGSVSSVEIVENRVGETDDEFASAIGRSRRSSNHRRGSNFASVHPFHLIQLRSSLSPANLVGLVASQLQQPSPSMNPCFPFVQISIRSELWSSSPVTSILVNEPATISRS
ncbi:hypothetical protein HHK36_006456 [Tetracentron sinense]|uniref:Uncharacterized protein n=1 Tax=Tetracentron sinense TaxID=13715 RepID=A0A835DP77_TETSI|nr:hypothetical protein HHK36_006456 [Tetracentron sinense]